MRVYQERKLRRQAEGEVKAFQRKIDSLEAERSSVEAKVGSLVQEAERRRDPLSFVNPIRPRL